MLKRRIAIISFIFLFLTACTNEDTATVDVEPINNDENQSEDYLNDTGMEEDEPVEREETFELDERFLSDLQTISLIDSRETLKIQQGGILVRDIPFNEEIGNTSNNPLDSTEILEIKRELEKLMEHTENPSELYKGIVYLLGSPNYKEAMEMTESFEPNFEEFLSGHDSASFQTKAPGPWEVLDEYDRFDENLNQIREIVKTEKSRYDQALQIIHVEKLLEQHVIDELSDILIEEYRAKLDLISEFRAEKLEEIDQEAEDIRKKADERKMEMMERKEDKEELF